MLLVKLTVDTRTVLYRFHFRLLLVALNHLALEGHGVHEPWIVGWTLARQQLVVRDRSDVLLVGVLHEFRKVWTFLEPQLGEDGAGNVSHNVRRNVLLSKVIGRRALSNVFRCARPRGTRRARLRRTVSITVSMHRIVRQNI